MTTEGFWPQKTVSKPHKTVSKAQSQGCGACGLYKGCKSPRMPLSGDGRLRVFVLAEAPGTDEDVTGKQLVGDAGQRLRRELRKHGIDLDQDCWKMDAVSCRPVKKTKDSWPPAASVGLPDEPIDFNSLKNRTPTDKEIACCRSRVWTELEKLKPRLILLLGKAAITSFLGHRWHKELGGVTKWRGWCIPDRDVGAWICPTFHPSDVIRMEKAKQPVTATIWRQDLTRALKLINEPVPYARQGIWEKELVEVIINPRQAALALRELRPDKLHGLSFDYEATGIKPYVEGHRIVSGSFYTGYGRCISTPIHHRDYDFRDVVCSPIKRLLINPTIGKSAHGIKFEDTWTNVKLGHSVQGWQWCGMNAAHVLDNRAGITSLKFQVYVRFGVIDYASHVTPYLSSDVKKYGANAFNKVDDAPLEDLLLYGGLDSVFEHKLAEIQQREIVEQGLEAAYTLKHKGTLALAPVERAGMVIDLGYCERHLKHNRERVLPYMEREILDSKLGREWRTEYGDKTNLNSDPQLRKVLYGRIGEKPAAETDKGTPKVDQATLEHIKVPGVPALVKRAKLDKTVTYLDGLLREAPDGWLHPFFHSHLVTSYRGSSSNINFQNIPVRDEQAQKLIRSAIFPRSGRQLLCIDYGGIEVRVACCRTKDPKLIHDTLHGDMHLDMAIELYMLNGLDKNDSGEKNLRQGAKNGFVFPEFYGDYYDNCVAGLLKWAKISKLKDGTPALVHLQDKGLVRLNGYGEVTSHVKFTKHVQAVEDVFWNERYRVYTQWKKDHMREYEKCGYFDLMTGFRCGGAMRRNVVSNLPIQGPAYHCLLWSLIRLQEIAHEEQWESLIIGQIHDEIVSDVVPDEVPHIMKTARRVMCEEIREEWPWIIVPLVIEAEITPIDQPWFYKKELKRTA